MVSLPPQLFSTPWNVKKLSFFRNIRVNELKNNIHEELISNSFGDL